MSIKKVIIVGGSGFLGSHIAEKIALAKEEIDLAYADLVQNPNLHFEYIPIDLFNPKSLNRLNEYDIVINCTGQVTNPFNLCYRLNTEGINNLLKIMKNTSSRVIQISTTAVYGSGEHCDESTSISPETNYATAKAIAEFQLQIGLISSRLAILRLSNLYGPEQREGIIAYLLKSFFSDRKLFFNNDGNLIRSYMHVQDAAQLIADCVLESEISGIYNLKGPDTYSIKGLIDAFEKEFNIEFDKEFSDREPWENIKNLDDSRICDLISIKFEQNLMSYFRQMLVGA